MRDDVNLSMEHNIVNIEVEIDAQLLKLLILGNTNEHHHLNNFIYDCRYLMQCPGVRSINHVYCEANVCADILANQGSNIT
ncbi:hypothetical protein ACSBR2_033156 [Camellia fascicularis]